MERRVGTARAHGGIAGHPYAEDEGRRLTVAAACSVSGPGQFRYEVRLTSSHDPEAKTVSFDVDSPFPIEPPALADAALLVAVFPALLHGGELVVEGTVSRRLFRNVVELQAVWTQARPDLYRPFRLTAAHIADDVRPVNDEAIIPLSGGVDSMLMLCRHTDPARPLGAATQAIGACLFIPGFSPKPDRLDEYEAATGKVREIAARKGLPLAVAETNFGTVVPTGVFAHGTMIAAALTLFSSRFGVGLIGASVPYLHPRYRFYGSVAWLDPLHSSGAMDVRDDATDMLRDEKVAALCRYPDMLDELIVCFEVEGMTGNCCRCEKCTRTMLSFLAVGEEIPPAFPKGLDMARIGKRLGLHNTWSYALTTLEVADATGVKHPALSKLKRRYLVKRAKYQVRYFLTWLIPGVNLLTRDSWMPEWLIQRNARRARKRPRRPWYRPSENRAPGAP